MTLKAKAALPNPGGMPEWMWLLFEQYMPAQNNADWTPKFAPQQYIEEPNNAGGVNIQPLAITDFPTSDTAQHLHDKYCANGQIITTPCPYVGGPDESPVPLPPYYSLVWPHGKAISVSVLAGIWLDNPGQPDAADNLCTQLIAAFGAK